MTEFWQESQKEAPADITFLKVPEVFINYKVCILKTPAQAFTVSAIIMSRFCA